MTGKQFIFLVGKILVLTVSLFIIFTIASMVAGLSGGAGEMTAEEAAAASQWFFFVCLLHTAVLAYPILRSRWSGWRLVLTIFLVYYGIMTLLSQIESVVFLRYLVDVIPAEDLPKLFVQGLVVTALYSPLAVFVLGRMKKDTEAGLHENKRLKMPPLEWVWKLAVIAISYVILYVLFGYFVAWQSPTLREYYANLQMPQWMLLFQVFRGLIWAALAVPVVKMMKGPWWESGLAVSLLYSILMSSLLMLPNEYMPEAVRWVHFKEVLLSNFIFGWVTVRLLTLKGRA